MRSWSVLGSSPDKVSIDSITDEEEFTVALRAVQSGSFELVDYLVSQGNASLGPEKRNQFGFTSAHLAAFHEVPSDLFEYILDKGGPALINAQENGGWSPLIIAASKGNLRIVKLLLDHGADVNVRSGGDQTALYVACHNGFAHVMEELMKKGADATIRLKQSLESPAFGALTTGRIEILKRLLAYDPSLISLATVSGATLLHAAAQIGKMPSVELLISLGADVDAKKKDGTSPLAGAAALGHVEVVKRLSDAGASLDARNGFGATALHLACNSKQLKMAIMLLECGAEPNAADSDRISPLQSLCSSSVVLPDNPNCAAEIAIYSALVKHGADLLHKDRAEATFLHQLVCKPSHLALLTHILEKETQLNLFAEDRYEYTALHVAHRYKHTEVIEVLSAAMKKQSPEKFALFDANKPRKEPTIGVNDLIEAVPLEVRQSVLNFDLSLPALASLISSGRVKNVIVMSGAGVSTNSGIPDFRSPDRGLYTSPQFRARFTRTGAESWTHLFSQAGLMQHPEDFFMVMKEVFGPAVDGRYKPTLTHFFLKLLQDKGLLLRNYTQNIDMLERLVGIPKEKLIEAHGTFARARCVSCRTKCTNMQEYWHDVLGDLIPRCTSCRGVMRPDVVFFGEGMPADFSDRQIDDFQKCDLLLVMGTSLKVYPFAGLTNQVPNVTPRVLFNNEAVGPFAHGARWSIVSENEFDDEDKKESSKKQEATPKDDSPLSRDWDAEVHVERVKHKDEYSNSYRDISLLGDIDTSVLELVKAIGWADDLKSLIANYTPSPQFD